jgi:hypothetical protein
MQHGVRPRKTTTGEPDKGPKLFFPAGRKANDFVGVFSIEKFCKSKIAVAILKLP